MITITTHVLDTSRGRPAAGLAVTLSVRTGERWTELGQAKTGADGRVPNMVPAQAPSASGTVFRLSFAVEEYFAAQEAAAFYPSVDVVFRSQENGHHHVPLLVSPFGYTTYRGS